MTGTIKQREALAILIGWQRADSKKYGWVNPQGHQEAVQGKTIRFNPFENANDDFEILKWMQNEVATGGEYYLEIIALLSYVNNMNYEIGSWAAALLRAIERKEEMRKLNEDY